MWNEIKWIGRWDDDVDDNNNNNKEHEMRFSIVSSAVLEFSEFKCLFIEENSDSDSVAYNDTLHMILTKHSYKTWMELIGNKGKWNATIKCINSQ